MQSVKDPRIKDMDGINEMFNDNKDKRVNSGHLLQKKRPKNVQDEGGEVVGADLRF